MMCIIFINILSTVSLDIFVGTVKQIVKFISYLTTVTIKKIKVRKLKPLNLFVFFFALAHGSIFIKIRSIEG